MCDTKITGYELLTKTNAAKMMGVSTTTVWRAVRRGDIRTVKVGNTEYIPMSELMRLQEGNNVKSVGSSDGK